MLTPESTADSIRFQLVEQPKGKDCSSLVEPVEEAVEGTSAAMEMDNKAEEFPLAKLDLKPGMEIRLAFEGEATTRIDRGPYFWIWPMIVHILAGHRYNAGDKDQNKADLNVSSLGIYLALITIDFGDTVGRISSMLTPKSTADMGGSEERPTCCCFAGDDPLLRRYRMTPASKSVSLRKCPHVTG